MNFWNCRFWLTAAAAAFALAGCGGGGGGSAGGASGGTGGGGGGGTSATGLIPSAPALGAALHADATLLQPLRPGAEWHYRGSVTAATGRRPFGVKLRQSAGAAGVVVQQRRSSAPDDDDSVTFANAGGAITATETLQLAAGAASGLVSYTVLRSPVRQFDQVTLLDQLAVPSGADIDGDSVEDKADVAVYSRVIGNESVDLPDLQLSVVALRVDTTVWVRFTQSSNGLVRSAIGFLQSDWYAPGIGIVRSASTGASASPSAAAYEINEHLVYWDGITEGVGALPPVAVRPPAAAAPLNQPWSAVRVGERVLLATTTAPGPAASVQNGFVLSALDKNGMVLASQSYPALRLTAPSIPLLPLAGGVGLVNLEVKIGNTGTVSYEARLRRFDSSAAVVGAEAGVALTSDLPNLLITAASDGTKLWLLWAQGPTSPDGRSQVWLRDFDSGGQPVGAARLLESPKYFNGRLALAAAPGRVLATWASDDTFASLSNRKYALVLGGATAPTRVLGIAAEPSGVVLTPVVSASRQSLAWAGSLGFGGFSGFDDGLMRAIAIADDGSPIRSAALTLDAEVLAARPGTVRDVGPSSGASELLRAIAFADGNNFGAAVIRGAVMLPALETFATNHLLINDWPTVGALAGTAPTVRLRRLEWFGFAPVTPFAHLEFVVPFEDRLLALGYDNNQGLSAVVVFRR